MPRENLLTRKQEFELITSIKGRGEIPVKFCYLGEGAKEWDRIAKRRTSVMKGINTFESDLLKKRIKNIVSTFSDCKKINIIDIGCGNGEPVAPILDELSKLGITIRYVPIDISREMLDIAKDFVSKRYKNIEIKTFQLDFELGNFSDIIFELKGGGYSNLLLHLGSTLGNHSDRQRVLANFRDSMSSDDYLIIGVELTNFLKINKILPHYEEKELGDILYLMPEYIGIDRKDTDYDFSWNDKLNQVEVKMILKKDARVKIGDEKFTLEKGEAILLVRSVKFSEWSITKLMSDVGFRTELLTTNPDRGYLLSMIQPTRYSV